MDNSIKVLVVLAILTYPSTVRSYGGYQYRYERQQHFHNHNHNHDSDSSEWSYPHHFHHHPYQTGFGNGHYDYNYPKKEFGLPPKEFGIDSSSNSGSDENDKPFWNKGPQMNWGNNNGWGYPDPTGGFNPDRLSPNGNVRPPRPVQPFPGVRPRPTPEAIPSPMPDTTTTPSVAQPRATPSGSTSTPLTVLMCIRTCPVTSEFNPVCGSNNITYNNPGRLECAINCGVDVTLQRPTSCNIPPTQAPTDNTPQPVDPTRFTTIDLNNGGSTSNPIMVPDPTNQGSTISPDILASIFTTEGDFDIDIRTRDSQTQPAK